MELYSLSGCIWEVLLVVLCLFGHDCVLAEVIALHTCFVSSSGAHSHMIHSHIHCHVRSYLVARGGFAEVGSEALDVTGFAGLLVWSCVVIAIGIAIVGN